jgi:undecaprenyl-diphosphatase
VEQLTIIQAIILGIVEGITEYLPISSTGHLIITSALMGLDNPAERKEAVDAFNIVIQGGAILAVLGLYRKRVGQMIMGLLGKNPAGLRLTINLFIAFLPAAVFGVLLHGVIKDHLFRPIPVIAALALGGVVMLLIGPWQKKHFHGDEHADPADSMSYVDIEHLTWKRALIVGLLQCVAMCPGTSRSMMTILGGMMVGLKPKQAAEFSFLLGLPTLGGACVYEAASNILKDDASMLELGLWPCVVGLIAAFIAAALSIKWLVGFLSKHGVSLFGWYRIAISIVLALMAFKGLLSHAF